MIEFEGQNYTFEVFSYVFENPLRTYNMDRIHFGYSPIGIDYIEGSLIETDCEFIETHGGLELTPIITCMRINSIHRIVFKDGTEHITKDMENARVGLAVPVLDATNHVWNSAMER